MKRRWDGAYLAEVDFVEDDLVGVADAPEPGQEGQACDEGECDLVVSFRAGGIDTRLACLGNCIDVGIEAGVLLQLAGAGDISLAQASLRVVWSPHDGRRRRVQADYLMMLAISPAVGHRDVGQQGEGNRQD